VQDGYPSHGSSTQVYLGCLQSYAFYCVFFYDNSEGGGIGKKE